VAAGEGQRKSNSNFKSAVAAWKLLSDEQRKVYTSNFKEHQQARAGRALLPGC